MSSKNFSRHNSDIDTKDELPLLTHHLAISNIIIIIIKSSQQGTLIKPSTKSDY